MTPDNAPHNALHRAVARGVAEHGAIEEVRLSEGVDQSIDPVSDDERIERTPEDRKRFSDDMARIEASQRDLSRHRVALILTIDEPADVDEQDSTGLTQRAYERLLEAVNGAGFSVENVASSR